MSQPIRGQGGHLGFSIGPKNTNLLEDVQILLPVKFHWIPFSGFRGEVENVSANQRPGRPSCFSDRPEKHKLGRGRWDLASCQVSLNSVQWFQRRSQKCEKITKDDGRTTDDGQPVITIVHWAFGSGALKTTGVFEKQYFKYEVSVIAKVKVFFLPRTHRQETRQVFVKHGCPRRQQSQNMAKSYIFTPPNPPGACDVSEVWATLRWTYS